jgi:type VI secretion system Hcp family effector
MRTIFVSITLFIALLFAIPAFAQTTTIFVKIIDANGNQIKGESMDANHKDEIIAESFGQDNTGCAVGSGSCGGTLGNFIFNMNGDKSLPLLNQALFSGTQLRSVDIVFRKTFTNSLNPVEYFKVHLETVSIVHVTNSLGESANAPLLSQVALSAAKAGWTYTAVRQNGPDSPVKWGWDAIQKLPWLSF